MVLVATGHLAEAGGAQRIEADGHAAQASALERVGLIGKEDAVGGEREIVDARILRQQGDEAIEILAQQRLAAGEAHAGDAQAREDFHQASQLLEAQQLLARKPDVILLRHAVKAAQVAAIGDGQAQAFKRAAQAITHRK